MPDSTWTPEKIAATTTNEPVHVSQIEVRLSPPQQPITGYSKRELQRVIKIIGSHTLANNFHNANMNGVKLLDLTTADLMGTYGATKQEATTLQMLSATMMHAIKIQSEPKYSKFLE